MSLVNKMRFCSLVVKSLDAYGCDNCNEYKVRVATMTHDHDDTHVLFLMLLVVSAGK